MQNLVRIAALTTLVVSALSTPALAQLSSKASSAVETIPLRIKLGVWRPSGQATRTLSGSQVPGGMVDLSGSRAEDSRTLTVGYFQGSSVGKSFRIAPLLITKTSAGSSGSSGTSGFFTSQGVGAYFIDAAGSGFKVRYGGYTGAGLRLSGGLFVEAQYHYVSGSVNGASPNGIALFIGRRN